MDHPEINTEFAPLDHIRHNEAQVTRRIAAARLAAEKLVGQKRLDAKPLINQARETGKREGQTIYKEIISKAEDDAKALLAQAHSQAEKLQREGNRRMVMAVDCAVNIIIGSEKDESQ